MTKYEIIEPDYSLTEEERVLQGIAAWASFYKANINRFVEDFLHIKLKRFQQILIVAMNIQNYFCYMASRGQWLRRSGMGGVKRAKSVKALLLTPR